MFIFADNNPGSTLFSKKSFEVSNPRLEKSHLRLEIVIFASGRIIGKLPLPFLPRSHEMNTKSEKTRSHEKEHQKYSFCLVRDCCVFFLQPGVRLPQ